MKFKAYKILIFLILICLFLINCSQTQDVDEQKFIVVKIPPVRDEKLSNEERYWQFQKFLFPQIEIPKAIPKGLPNDDSLFYVKLEENKSVKINTSTICNLDSIDDLQKELVDIFKQRRENRVFEPSSNKFLKAVIVSAPDSAKYGEVFKLIEAVEQSGADPIVLKIGELPNAAIISIE